MPRTEVTETDAYKPDSSAQVFIDELKKAKFSPRMVGFDQVLDTILRGRDAWCRASRWRRAAGDECGDERGAERANAQKPTRWRTSRKVTFALARRPLNRKWWGLAFVLPVVGFFAVFNVFPVLFGFYLSLTDYDLLNPPEWVGFDNFSNLLSDDLFLKAFANTLVFVAGTTVPVWLLSLLAALLFDQVFRARNILKAIFFLPVLPPVVVVAVVWRMLLHPNGIMTWLAGSFAGRHRDSTGCRTPFWRHSR